MAGLAIFSIAADAIVLASLVVNVRGIHRNNRRARELEIQAGQLARMWSDFVIEKSQ